MKTLNEWLERLLEAKGMPEDVKSRAWIISKALMKVEGRNLGLDGIAKERRTIEAARQARDEIEASGLSFGHLTSADLAQTSWEPFAEAVWSEAVAGLSGFENASKKAAKFQALVKWLLPILEK